MPVNPLFNLNLFNQFYAIKITYDQTFIHTELRIDR